MTGKNSRINSAKLELLAVERKIRQHAKIIALIEENEAVAPRYLIPFGVLQILTGLLFPPIHWQFYLQSKVSEIVLVVVTCFGLYFIFAGTSTIVSSLVRRHRTERIKKLANKLEERKQKLEEIVSADS